MDDHIDHVLLDREKIAVRVAEMARRIFDDFRRIEAEVIEGESVEITLVAIPTGSLIFVADLIRDLPLMMRIRLVTVSSYPGSSTISKGAQLQGRLPDDLTGQHVLIVDDVLDSGGTLRLVREELERRRPASLRTCVLLRKRLTSAMKVPAEYVGFDIPDTFVVGYGLDYDGYYRNLPDVVTLKPEVFAAGADA